MSVDFNDLYARYLKLPMTLQVAIALVWVQALYILVGSLFTLGRLTGPGQLDAAGGATALISVILFMPAGAAMVALGALLILGRRFAWYYALVIEAVFAAISLLGVSENFQAQLTAVVAVAVFILLLVDRSRAHFARRAGGSEPGPGAPSA